MLQAFHKIPENQNKSPERVANSSKTTDKTLKMSIKVLHNTYYRVEAEREVHSLETAGIKGESRRQKQKGQRRKERRASHFRTTRFGGFEETQIICYLWDIVKSVEILAVDRKASLPSSQVVRTEDGVEELTDLARQLRKRIQVEIRRYFLRRKRRNVRLIIQALLAAVCVMVLFGILVGVDRVSGDSMYPYLNNGDWIIYSRLCQEKQRDEVVVFEKNGESLVKRIAGLPGDTVEISSLGDSVIINGVQVRENYVTLTNPDERMGPPEETDMMGPPLKVMDGQYLVLGDNRSVSIDSRDSEMGTVSEGEILGKVILIIRTNG